MKKMEKIILSMKRLTSLKVMVRRFQKEMELKLTTTKRLTLMVVQTLGLKLLTSKEITPTMNFKGTGSGDFFFTLKFQVFKAKNNLPDPVPLRLFF